MTYTVAGRPLVGRLVVGVWIVLAAGLYVTFQELPLVADVSLLPLELSTDWDAGVNTRTFYVATEAAFAGEDIYAVYPEDASEFYTYLYPPITVLGFAPLLLVSQSTALVGLSVLSAIACLAAGWLVVRYVEPAADPLGWIDVAALGTFFFVSGHSLWTVYYGNINLLLLLLFAVGFVALEADRGLVSGAAFSVAALFKLFPAVVGLYFLRRRAWTAVGTALAIGIGGIAVGAILFGIDTSRQYFFEVLPDRTDSEAFVGGYDPAEFYYVTIQRPLSHVLWEVWPSAPADVLPVVSALVVLPVLLVFYVDVTTRFDRVIAMFATIVAMLVVMPSMLQYMVLLYAPLFSLLYLWGDRPGWLAFVAGAVLFLPVERPSSVVDTLSVLPSPLFDVLAPLAAVASIQLWGMALMLGACAWYKFGPTTWTVRTALERLQPGSTGS